MSGDRLVTRRGEVKIKMHVFWFPTMIDPLVLCYFYYTIYNVKGGPDMLEKSIAGVCKLLFKFIISNNVD